MDLIEKLEKSGRLSADEYEILIKNCDEYCDKARLAAVRIRQKIYKNHVYIRGLIDRSNSNR